MPSHDSSSNLESLPTETLTPVPEFDDDEYQPIQPKVLLSIDGEEEDDYLDQEHQDIHEQHSAESDYEDDLKWREVSSLGGGKSANDSGEHHEDGEMKPLPGAIRQPCSAHCPRKRNQLPNLMCSKCFCFFHIGCVPDGEWLENPNRFICPVS